METVQTVASRPPKILATIYAACNVRGVNPYHFIKDYLDGKVDTIPLPQESMVPVCVST